MKTKYLKYKFKYLSNKLKINVGGNPDMEDFRSYLADKMPLAKCSEYINIFNNKKLLTSLKFYDYSYQYKPIEASYLNNPTFILKKELPEIKKFFYFVYYENISLKNGQNVNNLFGVIDIDIDIKCFKPVYIVLNKLLDVIKFKNLVNILCNQDFIEELKFSINKSSYIEYINTGIDSFGKSVETAFQYFRVK